MSRFFKEPIVLFKFKKPTRQVNKVYIHCSATDVKAHDNIETIKKWHVEEKGWDYVGYHYFIRKDGMIEEGRALEVEPAAQKDFNTGSIAICLSGKKKEFFTQKQFDSLKKLCEEINLAYDKITFHGHCEVSKKKCPVFDYKNVLSLDEGLMPLYILSTQSKNSMIPLVITGAISLIKILAPSIINKFKKAGKTLAEETAKNLIKKVEKKLGFNITDVKSAEKARDQLDSKDLLQLEKAALRSDVKMFLTEMKFGEKLGGWNLKDEWVILYAIGYPSYITYKAFEDPILTLAVIEVIKTLFATPFGIVFIVACISASGGKGLLYKVIDRFFLK